MFSIGLKLNSRCVSFQQVLEIKTIFRILPSLKFIFLNIVHFTRFIINNYEKNSPIYLINLITDLTD